MVKITELENGDLVIYKRKTRNQDVRVCKDSDTVLNSNDNDNVTQDSRDTDVKSPVFIQNMENMQISCPRCRQLMDHSLKLLQNALAAKENNIMAVCEHCKLKAQPSCYCKELAKGFIRRFNVEEHIKKRVKEWLTEINKLHRDEPQTDLSSPITIRVADQFEVSDRDNLSIEFKTDKPQSTRTFKYNYETNKDPKTKPEERDHPKISLGKKVTTEKVGKDKKNITVQDKQLTPKMYYAKGDRNYKVIKRTIKDNKYDENKSSSKSHAKIEAKQLLGTNETHNVTSKPKVTKNALSHTKSKVPVKKPKKLDKFNKNMTLQARLENKHIKNKELEEEAQKKTMKKHFDKDIKLSRIKMLKVSQDNLILNKVKLNSPPRNRFKAVPDLVNLQFDEHLKCKTRQDPKCSVYNKYIPKYKIDIERNESDVSVSDVWREKKYSISDIIVWDKILKKSKYEVTFNKTNEFYTSKTNKKPVLFEKNYSGLIHIYNENEEFSRQKTPTHVSNQPSGIISYALSDRSFIDKGWTVLPTEKIVRKLNVYRMRPARPEFDWFNNNKSKGLMLYDSGEKLAEFDDNGRGRWYYKNGRLALDYYDAEELNAQQRFVIFSNGEPDERGRPRPYTILATFDYLGNGIVFDHSGKIRLKYNQTEGVLLDKNVGPVSRWKWHALNDPPVLHKVMKDTHLIKKDLRILKMSNDIEDDRIDDEKILEIEYDNLLKEKNIKQTQTFKPFQIRMKAVKINEHFSLKVLDQATVYLIYRDGTTNLKLNIGMILDSKEIVDTEMAEIGEVSNNVERHPARTDSLIKIQERVASARRLERKRTEREQKLRPTAPSHSADRLTVAASSPLQYPLRTVPSCLTSTTHCCYESHCIESNV